LGPGASAAADALKQSPIDDIRVGEDVSVDKFLVRPAVDALEAVIRSVGDALVLMPASNSGKDIAARIAARLGAGIITEATDIAARGGKVAVASPKLGGTVGRELGLQE